ncbi:MAG: DUF2721 domain-containing protein [Bauldia sp.]
MESEVLVEASPWVALSLIGAPALMTNATSLMVMSTANRLARTVDRARAIAREAQDAAPDLREDIVRSLALAQRRALVTMRALSLLYGAIMAFAAATLAAFVGSIPSIAAYSLMTSGTLIVTFVLGGLAFVALMLAAGLLVGESLMGHQLLQRDIARIRRSFG